MKLADALEALERESGRGLLEAGVPDPVEALKRLIQADRAAQ